MKFIMYDIEDGISRMEIPIEKDMAMPTEILCFEPYAKYACYFPDSFTFEECDELFFKWFNDSFDDMKMQYENFLDTIHWIEKK